MLPTFTFVFFPYTKTNMTLGNLNGVTALEGFPFLLRKLQFLSKNGKKAEDQDFQLLNAIVTKIQNSAHNLHNLKSFDPKL